MSAKPLLYHAAEISARRMANVLGLSHCPIVWAANPYYEAKISGQRRRTAKGQTDLTYPLAWAKITNIREPEAPTAGRNKEANHPVYGAASASGSRTAMRLTTVEVTMTVEYVTNDPLQLIGIINDLVMRKVLYEQKDKSLSFRLTSKEPAISIANTLYLTNTDYEIEEQEYAEDVPTEYSIRIGLTLRTKAHSRDTDGNIKVALIETLDGVNSRGGIVSTLQGSPSEVISFDVEEM